MPSEEQTPEERARRLNDDIERYVLGWRLGKGIEEDIAAEIRAAVEAEREACAAICEAEVKRCDAWLEDNLDEPLLPGTFYERGARSAADRAARAIRSRAPSSEKGREEAR